MPEYHITHRKERKGAHGRIKIGRKVNPFEAQKDSAYSKHQRNQDNYECSLFERSCKKINDIEEDVDFEQTKQEPYLPRRIILIEQCRPHLAHGQISYIYSIISQNIRYQERTNHIKEYEWNQQFVDLALDKSSEALVCLEEAARQEEIEWHSECLEEIVERKSCIIEQRKMKTNDQSNTNPLGQINVFYPRLLYYIFRHNKL